MNRTKLTILLPVTAILATCHAPCPAEERNNAVERNCKRDEPYESITDRQAIQAMLDPNDFLSAGSIRAAVFNAAVPKPVPQRVREIRIHQAAQTVGDQTRRWAQLLDSRGRTLGWVGSVNGGKWNNPVVAGPFLKPPKLTEDGRLAFDHTLRDRCIAVKAVNDAIQADDLEADSFSFAVFTDTHVKPKGFNRMHTGLLMQAMGEILAMSRRPDFLVVTGDLDSGTGDARYGQRLVQAGNLQNWLRLISLLEMPVYPMPGNHDPRYAFRWLILGQREREPTTDPVCYAFNAGKWRMIVLGRPIGYDKTSAGPYRQKIANWLEKELRTHKDRPTMVFSHDPMVRITCGGFYTDQVADRFLRSSMDRRIILELLGKYGNVRWVFNGHIHCCQVVRERGINFVSCLSTMGNNYDGKIWHKDKWWDNGWMLVNVNGEDVTVYKKHIDRDFEQIASSAD